MWWSRLVIQVGGAGGNRDTGGPQCPRFLFNHVKYVSCIGFVLKREISDMIHDLDCK